MIKFGRAKHLEKIELKHVLKHPIWVSAHDERHDEEYEKPIINLDDVTEEIELTPIITFKVDGTDDLYGSGCFNDAGYLYSIALWIEDHWVIIQDCDSLQLPATFISVPRIRGESEVKFLCKDRNKDRAFRIN